MTGEKNIDKLLQGLKPFLNSGTYVFVNAPFSETLLEQALGLFKEKEGITYILDESIAKNQGLSFDYRAAWISLHVHSALDAVGLTAAVANALAANNISCNVVAAFFHDHIFVDYEKREKAMDVLTALSISSRKSKS